MDNLSGVDQLEAGEVESEEPDPNEPDKVFSIPQRDQLAGCVWFDPLTSVFLSAKITNKVDSCLCLFDILER